MEVYISIDVLYPLNLYMCSKDYIVWIYLIYVYILTILLNK